MGLVLASVALLGLDWPGQGAARAAEFAHAATDRRLELLHLLAPSTEPEARAVMAAALDDADPSVRGAARRLAVRFPSPALVPALVRVLAEADPAARSEAVLALAGVPSDEARRAIELALADRNAAVRVSVVRALSRTGASAVVSLLDRVHDPEGDVRAAAAEALGEIGDPRAVLALVGISQDPIPEVRLAATRALGGLGGEVATRTLVGMVHDPLPDVQQAALEGLSRRPDPSLVPTLASLARVDASVPLAGRDALARAAIETLGAIDSPEARRVLLDLALSPRLTLAPVAVAALGEHPESARRDVRALLARLDRDTLGVLAPLLGRLGGDEVADAMIELLEHGGTTPSAREAALLALGTSGSDHALRSLLERLTAAPSAGTSFRVRGCPRATLDPTLLTALDRWTATRGGLDPLALDPLGEAVQRVDPACHPQVVALVRLLGATGNERAGAALRGYLRHPDATVRVAAARGMSRLGGDEVLASLIEALTDDDVRVRTAAMEALRSQRPDTVAPALAARWRDPRAVDRGGLLLALGHALSTAQPATRAQHAALLREAARTGALRTRAAAVRALGDVAGAGDADALAVLRSLVADAHLGLVAVEALGNLPRVAAAPWVPELIRRATAVDAPIAARLAAAWALRGGDPAALDALRELAAHGPDVLAQNARVALDRPMPVGAVATDLRVLDVGRQPVSRRVRVVLGDGAWIWATPDADGWLRVRDAAPGALRVVDPGDEG